jgi:hypothetical protein
MQVPQLRFQGVLFSFPLGFLFEKTKVMESGPWSGLGEHRGVEADGGWSTESKG